MLILLPPSEGKTQPISGNPCELGSLSFAVQLTDTRRRQWRAQPAAVRNAAAAPAHSVYSGVLYAALDYSSLPALGRRRANTSIIIISALFGAVCLGDHIPAYKASMSNTVWRAPLTSALSEQTGSGLVVDCRSTTYAGAYTPPTESTVALRVFKQTGKQRTVITHMSKQYRGLATRLLCCAPRAANNVNDVAEILSRQWTCELHPPSARSPWQLDIIVRD